MTQIQSTLIQLKAQLSQIEAELHRSTTARTPADAQARMLAALEAGPKSVPQLQAELGLTKSAAHYAHLALAQAGEIWIKKHPVPGKPGRWTNLCYRSDQIVTQ